MLPVTKELPDYYSEQANEISPCSELNPFLNMLHVRMFPIQGHSRELTNTLVGPWVELH